MTDPMAWTYPFVFAAWVLCVVTVVLAAGGGESSQRLADGSGALAMGAFAVVCVGVVGYSAESRAPGVVLLAADAVAAGLWLTRRRGWAALVLLAAALSVLVSQAIFIVVLVAVPVGAAALLARLVAPRRA